MSKIKHLRQAIQGETEYAVCGTYAALPAGFVTYLDETTCKKCIKDFHGTPTSKPDHVNHPAHYTQGKVECIDAIESAITGLNGMEAHCTGTAIKYLWRWKQKGGTEDLHKAKWYIDRILKGERKDD